MRLGPREAAIAGIAGVLGAGVAAALVVRFLGAYYRNDLGWTPDMAAGAFYDAQGRSYWHGFVAGFGMCLSLVLAGAGLEAWRARRREPAHR